MPLPLSRPSTPPLPPPSSEGEESEEWWDAWDAGDAGDAWDAGGVWNTGDCEFKDAGDSGIPLALTLDPAEEKDSQDQEQQYPPPQPQPRPEPQSQLSLAINNVSASLTTTMAAATATATTSTATIPRPSLPFANARGHPAPRSQREQSSLVWSDASGDVDNHDVETGKGCTAPVTSVATPLASEGSTATDLRSTLRISGRSQSTPFSSCKGNGATGEHPRPLHQPVNLDSEGSSMNSSLGSFGSGGGGRGGDHHSRSDLVAATHIGEANHTAGTSIVLKQPGDVSRLRSRHSFSPQYSVGTYLLVSDRGGPTSSPPTGLVNRHGFPVQGAPGLGCTTLPAPVERRGPYIYALARVVDVHFGQSRRYYTLRREVDGVEVRADAPWMVPLDPGGAGLAAAKAAAAEAAVAGRVRSGTSGGRPSPLGRLVVAAAGARWAAGCTRTGRARALTAACLDGRRPYAIRVRLTWVNFLVACSVWYLFADQLRLAFLPHNWDFGCAVVSAITWMFLILELAMEVFIRPDGYRALLRSDKAYLPSTARYINNFYLFSESISLVFFVPEFTCLLNPKMKCGDRAPFSLANACLMYMYGPTRLQCFYGFAFICVLRLRIFGLVRHWTNMWINNTFIRVRGTNGEWRVQRSRGLFVPQGFWGGARAMPMQGGQASTVGKDEGAALPLSMAGKSRRNVLPEQSSKAVLASLSPKNEVSSTPSEVEETKNEYTNDYHLTNASKIGTALFTTNAQRGLLFVFFIGLFPLIPICLTLNGSTNQEPWNSVSLLQQNNLRLNGTDDDTCAQLNGTMADWIKDNAFEYSTRGTPFVHLISLVVEPVRCEFQSLSAVNPTQESPCRSIDSGESCKSNPDECWKLCKHWRSFSERHNLQPETYLRFVRPSTTLSVKSNVTGTYYSHSSGERVEAPFLVEALYAEILGVRNTIITLFALQLGMTAFLLLGLSILRYDAGHLVLGPLRRMLKIVALYAKNPLMPPPKREGIGHESTVRGSFRQQHSVYYDSDDESRGKQLGTFETEQLVNAVTKITDLLRKCWGVAGAGIISSNLARQMGGLTSSFNPTVPGVAVYGIFAFVGIDNFQSHLYALKGDIMILINDIAAVLHEEVYRWSYNGTGQCNKNLGGAFLMIYKIGAVSEVLAKREKAEAVIFSRNMSRARRKSRYKSSLSFSAVRSGGSGKKIDVDEYSQTDYIDLSSLPGIRSFADRALLGLLKTFASISRDKTILNWNNDFRLGAGVGAASVNLNFGMDAGWAVEGAVGSKYKIDATYLSPHLNMGARMMSASKQYGVSFLLSQAVQRLLSENAQNKLRHIDTVTVKGSSLQQRIYTYDAKMRHDFFLYSRSDTQADLDADRYSPAIWFKDQDLLAMRNHISREFLDVFNRGRDEYLAGNWLLATRLLKKADKIMFERELEEGYSNESFTEMLKSLDLCDAENAEERLRMGDGPCQRLIAYMSERGGTAPGDWEGYRPLTSK